MTTAMAGQESRRLRVPILPGVDLVSDGGGGTYQLLDRDRLHGWVVLAPASSNRDWQVWPVDAPTPLEKTYRWRREAGLALWDLTGNPGQHTPTWAAWPAWPVEPRNDGAMVVNCSRWACDTSLAVAARDEVTALVMVREHGWSVGDTGLPDCPNSHLFLGGQS